MPPTKKSNQAKLIVPATKSRNPLVAPALVRKAGAHKKSAGSIRQEQEKAIRKRIAED
jgi:ornithine cyclodeaminase/alanine dehydrogenase-like protein (mu-crystallin family)